MTTHASVEQLTADQRQTNAAADSTAMLPNCLPTCLHIGSRSSYAMVQRPRINPRMHVARAPAHGSLAQPDWSGKLAPLDIPPDCRATQTDRTLRLRANAVLALAQRTHEPYPSTFSTTYIGHTRPACCQVLAAPSECGSGSTTFLGPRRPERLATSEVAARSLYHLAR